MRLSCLVLVICVVAIFMVACENKVQSEFISSDIAGADFARDFKLQDHTGAILSLSDFKNKVVVVFFGYTQCPDMCPTTMAELAGTMKKLGQEDADQVQVLFVTLDPRQDKSEILGQYVATFDPRFVGLTGSEETIKAVADEFKVYYKNQISDLSEQTVDHSTGTYIFDKIGNIRLYVRYGSGEETFVHDIKALLNAS